MKAKTEQVRRDLRRLRRVEHTIDVYMSLRERYNRRLEYLKSIKNLSQELNTEIQNTERFIESANIAEHIRRASELSERYIEVINKLEELDRAIIIDAFINGKPYWKIGKEIGYSERSVQYRVDEAIKAIARSI